MQYARELWVPSHPSLKEMAVEAPGIAACVFSGKSACSGRIRHTWPDRECLYLRA
jgi:hypothetical protein